MFRPRLRAPRLGLGLGLRSTVNARRQLHQVPELPHDYSQGVPNLMSPAGFAIAWNDYMTLMVEKLNALTVGMSDSPVIHGGLFRRFFFFFSRPSPSRLNGSARRDDLV